MKKYIEVTFIIEPADGQFAAHCQELGTASCGDTVEEAVANLREAVQLHLNALEELGERPRFFRERGIAPKSRHIQPSPVQGVVLPNFQSFVTKSAIPLGA